MTERFQACLDKENSPPVCSQLGAGTFLRLDLKKTFFSCMENYNCVPTFEPYMLSKNVLTVSNDTCDAPLTWNNSKCDPCYYNASDGCDCDCGAYDPDCNVASSLPYGCYDGGGAWCDQNGTCQYLYRVPLNWSCDPSFYNASDGCDCNCGAYDPDCDKDKNVLNCPCKKMECNEGICTGYCNGYNISYMIYQESPSHVGWIAFGTLLSLNLLLVAIYIVLYRKRRLLSRDNKQYSLLEK